MKTLTVDKLQVKIMPNRTEMGEVAATDICAKIKSLLAAKEEINIIFAAAPSQNDVLQSLVDSDIEWNRVNAFHMDEYYGLETSDPRRLASFLCSHFLDKVQVKNRFFSISFHKNTI